MISAGADVSQFCRNVACALSRDEPFAHLLKHKRPLSS